MCFSVRFLTPDNPSLMPVSVPFHKVARLRLCLPRAGGSLVGVRCASRDARRVSAPAVGCASRDA